VILPLGRLTSVADDRARDANRRHRARDVNIATSNREHLADSGGCSEHDFDDSTELSIRLRP
jgi:hypothetical protein